MADVTSDIDSGTLQARGPNPNRGRHPWALERMKQLAEAAILYGLALLADYMSDIHGLGH